MVFLTVFASIPVVYTLIAIEEKKDTAIRSERFLLKEHSKALAVLMFLFLGYTVAFSLWFVVLPEDTVTDMFNVQLETIRSINAKVTSFSAGTGFVMQIFSNNIKVMIFSLMFAFLFGAGAIFILTWNASVIAAAIGTFIKSNVANTGSSLRTNDRSPSSIYHPIIYPPATSKLSNPTNKKDCCFSRIHIRPVAYTNKPSSIIIPATMCHLNKVKMETTNDASGV